MVGPHMSAELKRSTDKERRWPVWMGSMEDLQRVARAVDEQAQIRSRIALADFDKETARQLAISPAQAIEGLKTPPELIDPEIKSYFEKVEIQMTRDRRCNERSTLERNFRMGTTIVDGDDTTTGDSGTVLAELDRRTVKSVQFSMNTEEDKIIVSFGRYIGYSFKYRSDYGVKLEVASSDRGWANQAYARLSDEVGKGEPGYSWLRKRTGRLAAIIASAVTTMAIVLMILPSVPTKYNSIVGFFAFCLFFLLSRSVAIPDWLLEWLAPRFEVTGEDRQSTARRRLGALIGVLVAFATGLAVNRIYG
jgi:hypothetical protein